MFAKLQQDLVPIAVHKTSVMGRFRPHKSRRLVACAARRKRKYPNSSKEEEGTKLCGCLKLPTVFWTEQRRRGWEIRERLGRVRRVEDFDQRVLC